MEVVIVKNKQELERLEGIILKNIGSFYEIGHALMEIRVKKYYHDVMGYETFEEYCKKRWDFARRTAYQYIDAVKTIENVRNCAQSDVVPANESQCRSLAPLTAENQLIAWQQAVATAPDGKVTAAEIVQPGAS